MAARLGSTFDFSIVCVIPSVKFGLGILLISQPWGTATVVVVASVVFLPLLVEVVAVVVVVVGLVVDMVVCEVLGVVVVVEVLVVAVVEVVGVSGILEVLVVLLITVGEAVEVVEVVVGEERDTGVIFVGSDEMDVEGEGAKLLGIKVVGIEVALEVTEARVVAIELGNGVIVVVGFVCAEFET